MTRLACFLPAILFGLALTPAGSAQERPTGRLSLDWLYGPTGPAEFNPPRHRWLPDGGLLLLDERVPERDRVLQRWDPATGQVDPLIDTVAALAELRALRQTAGEPLPAALPWPDLIDPRGRALLFRLGTDVFRLDLTVSAVRRLARTDGAPSALALSPDGERLAFVRGQDLHVVEVETGREWALTRGGGGPIRNGVLSWVYWEEVFGRAEQAFWWSPDGTRLAFLHTDESGVGESLFPDFEPATPRVERQRYPKAGSPNPRVRVGVVAVEPTDGADDGVTWLNLGQPGPEYVVRVGWHPNGREVAVQTLDRAQRRLELRLQPATGGPGRVVLAETAATSVNLHDNLRFLAGGERFLWTSERDGFHHLYLGETASGQLRRLSEGEWMIRPSSGDPALPGGVVAVDEAGGWVYLTATAAAPVGAQVYRVPLVGGPAERLTQRPGTHRVAFDPAGRFFLSLHSAADTPPGLYLHRLDGAEARVVAPPRLELLAELGVRTAEFLTIPAADGFPLPAQLLKPADFDPTRRYPVVLYVYGGPSAPVVRDAWDRNVFLQNLLLAEGCLYLKVDNRSASGLSKVLEDTAHGHLLGGPEIADILAAVAWLTAQPWVDPERVGVWGWSGGGTFTLQLMTHSTAFRAGIAVAGVTDFRYYDTIWTEARLGTPEANPEGYRVSAPAQFADRLSGRLLLIHGTGDDNVHPQNAWRMAHELMRAGKQFDMMIYPGGDHGISNARRHVTATMLEFWRRHLLAGGD